VQRYLAIAFFAVVMGCADDGTKVVPAQPVQGEPVGSGSNGLDGDDSSYEEDGEGDPTLVAENEGAGESSAPCAVSFTKDLMPKLATTCGTAACHKETIEPFVDDVAPQITYEGLRDFGFDDAAWTDPHPTESGLSEPTLAAAVEGWRKCGAPFE
jgi:hypothetical protein